MSFIQVVPNEGFIIHAVPADRRRAGFREQFAFGSPVCRKIKGRDAQGFPSLRVQFWGTTDGQYPTEAKPFSRNPEDFEISWRSTRICEQCAKKVMEHEEAA